MTWQHIVNMKEPFKPTLIYYTQLKTQFIFSSNTHLFKGTEGHFYQFRKKHLIFWVITNCTFLLFQGKAFNFLGNYK